MLVKDAMTKPVVCCTPRDTAAVAAQTMELFGVGALPVVSAMFEPLLEGIVTDRDLCSGVLASGKSPDAVLVGDVMTRVPVTCEPGDTLEDCQELMRANQVRRIPVVNDRGHCVGIVAMTEVARSAGSLELAATVREICEPTKEGWSLPAAGDYLYCGQTHELDQIALLKRRREWRRREEVPT